MERCSSEVSRFNVRTAGYRRCRRRAELPWNLRRQHRAPLGGALVLLLLTVAATGCGGGGGQGDNATGDATAAPGGKVVPAATGGGGTGPGQPVELGGAGPGPTGAAGPEGNPTGTDEVGAPVRVGAEVAADGGFPQLRGQRVGVVLNVASVVDGRSLLDVLAAADGVDLVAAFAPEHGVRGDAPAGASVGDVVDPATGVPVHSLYGDRKAPTGEQLAGLDVLVFDLQDVGARPYTYLSTMGLAMQAAARAGVRFVVLDRPNPLGGTGPAGGGVEGWVLDPALASFVGRYPVPLVHGLTAGELARMIQGEGWLGDLDGLQLDVVPMTGWQRTDRWADTGRAWVPPSPGLPAAATAAVYPGTVLFEATSASVGRGTDEPFRLIGTPWVDGPAAADELNRRGLPGVRFEPVTFTPEPTPAVPEPPLAGQQLAGVRVVVTDAAAVRPVALGVHLLDVFAAQARVAGVTGFVARPDTLDALAGTDRLRRALDAGTSAADIVATWSNEDARFDQLRQPYLLY